MNSNQSFRIVVNTILERIQCEDITFINLIRRALNGHVHIRSNHKDYTSKRSVQSLEGLINRREAWLLRTKALEAPIYFSLRGRLEKVL